jgi:ribosomal protein S24E
MNIEIKVNQKNVLLNRTSVEGSINFDATTPSNNEFANELAKKMKVDISVIVIKQILGIFGTKSANFKAVIYDTIDAKNKTEKVTKHLRKQAEESAKKLAQQKADEQKAKADEVAAKEKVDEQKVKEAETQNSVEETVKTEGEKV